MAALLARICTFGLLAARAALATWQAQRVTPVEKAIELLKKLQVQIGDDGALEAAQYDKFACFCKDQADDKLYAIEKSKKKITMLTATIKAISTTIDEHVSTVKENKARISEIEAKIKELKEKRAEEKAKYDEEAKDLETAIDAVERAIEAIKDAKAQIGEQDENAKLDLVQVRALAGRVIQVLQRNPSIQPTSSQLGAVQALLQEAQAPPSYSFHSNEIIGTLRDLMLKFKKNKKELDDAEWEKVTAFDKEVLNLTNEMKFLSKANEELIAKISKKEEELHEVETDKDKEGKAKDADQSFLDELTTTCEQKAKDFDQRSKVRAQELTAISDAIRTLEEGVKSNYAANEKLVELQRHVGAPSQPARALRAVSFLQSGSSATAEGTLPTNRVVEVLLAAATRLRSPMLSTLTLKVQVQKDHFVKVRGLIKDLLARLKADAEAEAETKSFCDKAMEEATSGRDDAKSKIEELAAETSQKESEKAKLEEEIPELAEEIAKLNKALNEAAELRASEKAANEATLAKAADGEEAVEKAIEILKDFYGSALLQYVPPNADRSGKSVGDLAPEAFEGEYHGNQDASKGIIGILEVILADFKRTQETVKAEEEEAQKAWEEFEEKTKEAVEAKIKEKEDKEARVVELKEELVKLEEKTADAKKMLKTALTELDKLKEMCVEGDENYEARKEKREKELEALKEALQILEDWKS